MKLLLRCALSLIVWISMGSSLSWSQELRDFTGERVQLSDHPKRVLTLAPSLSELAADLLEEDLEKIVGVSDLSLDPPALKKVESVGPYHRFNLEKVISLKPDLIFATQDGNSKDQILSLRERKFPVVVVSTESFQQIEDSILLMSKALGKVASGRRLVDRFRNGLEHFKARARTRSRLRVFIQLNDEPLITAGKKSFLTEALESVGGQNVYLAAEANYPRPSLEDVIQKDPDVILILGFTQETDALVQAQKKWTNFSKMKAVRENRVLIFKSDELLRPTLRMLEGLSRLENVLFGKVQK